MADNFADEIARSLRVLGCTVTSDPTSRYVEEPGRADLKVIKGGYGTMVEVKNGNDSPTIPEGGNQDHYHTYKKNKKTKQLDRVTKKHAGNGFDMTHWRENQREWAEKYCRAEPFNNEYWIALLIGVDNPDRNPEKLNQKTGLFWMPRRCWLIPHVAFTKVDAIVREYQNRLPYRNIKGMRKEIQEYNLDAVTLLKAYELPWAGGGKWKIPDSHVFSRYFLALQPRPLVTEVELPEMNHDLIPELS